MEKCTDTVVNWMIRCNAIKETDKELYKYALYSFFLLISPLILAGGIGFGLGRVKHGVALIFPFMVLRKFSGGYHAKKIAHLYYGIWFSTVFVHNVINAYAMRLEVGNSYSYCICEPDCI